MAEIDVPLAASDPRPQIADLATIRASSGEVNTASGAAPKSPLPLIWFDEIQPSLTNFWLVKKVLPLMGLALIYGHPGSGKSFFALDICFHIALGEDWNGRKVQPGLVIYIAAEGQAGLRNRVAAFRKHHGIKGRIPFVIIPTPINLQDPNADTNKLIETIQAAEAAAGQTAVLVVIDTISKTFGAGKENTDDMASYVANCGRVSAAFECLVMPIHHRPKDSENSDPRGHGSLKGGVDTIVLVEAGEIKRAVVTKQKDGEEGEAFHFSLKGEELGVDEDGETVTSCVVEYTDSVASSQVDPFARAVRKLSQGQRLIYEQLGELLESQGTAPPASIPEAEINRHRVGKVASFEAWRDKSILSSGTGAGHERDTGKRAFNRAVPALKNAGVVRVWGEWAWITHEVTGTGSGQVPGRGRDAGTGGTGVFRPRPVVPPRSSGRSACGLGESERPVDGSDTRDLGNGNPALADSRRSMRGEILAPGETGDEPVPGWEV